MHPIKAFLTFLRKVKKITVTLRWSTIFIKCINKTSLGRMSPFVGSLWIHNNGLLQKETNLYTILSNDLYNARSIKIGLYIVLINVGFLL